ncbi:shikimate kinase [Salipiger bermudensis]|uniref:shikimate kinase n=1 Tax=Salipiger bermudensis TaxID=344736 RepID=UPI001C98EC20|nr:shikimate kinase [Salipiger bermudensis]MBY6005809.1 shikimate kinase [Salipiger bermudensis]
MDGRDTSVQALKLRKTVVLVGMMGAGKTAVGKALAAALHVPFRDSDAEIELAANMTIAEIFSRDGEPFFRQKESQVISRLLDGAPSVLSTGGGAYMSAANRAMITERGVAVWLDAALPVLWNRVKHKNTRPLLRTPDPRATLREIYEQRVPVYALADVTVTSEQGKSVEAMAGRVIESLKARPDVLQEVTE